MTRSLRRVRIALDLPKDAPGVITRAMLIANCVDGNKWFPAPVPPIADVRVAIAALQHAEVAARSLTLGLATKRDVELGRVRQLLEQLKAYVQGIAQANLALAVAIVESAGMRFVKAGLPAVYDLKAEHDPVRNIVTLRARSAGEHALYYWQMSADGGKTWIDLGSRPTPKREKPVPGLARGQTYYFRYRAETPKLSTLWSASVGLSIP